MTFLRGLIDASAAAGAAGVKFQVLTKADDFISSRHKAFKDLSSYCLNQDQWAEIFQYTISKNLDIVMMPLNLDSLKLTSRFPVKYLDIHSVSFYDVPLLEAIRKTGIGVILGVGGRTFGEIVEKKKFFNDQLKVLMVGFQSFPSKLEEVKIGKIAYLKNLFPDVTIGYADHSAFDNEYAVTSNEYARLLGAEIFEKHITTAEGVDRVDYSAAVSPEKISLIIKKLDFLDRYVMTPADDAFTMNESEVTYRNRQLRCVASEAMENGTMLTEQNISLKLVDNQDNTFAVRNDLVGKKLKRRIEKDEIITSEIV